jgi:phage-related protein
MKTVVLAVVNGIKTSFIRGFSTMKNSVVSKVNSIRSTITSVFNSIKSRAYGWGRNLLSGFIRGFWSKFGSLKSAVKSAASTISDFLGFSSPTKEGAGRFADEWMPNFIDMITDGLKDGIDDVGKVSMQLAEQLQPNMMIPSNNIMDSNNVSTINQPIVININGDHMDIDSIGDKLVNKLYSYGIKTYSR